MTTALVTAPLKTSPPPAKIVEYEFSFSRSTGHFRFRHQGNQWLCRSLGGDAVCRRADGHEGVLFLVCQLSIDSDRNATVWAPEGDLLAALQAEVSEPSNAANFGDWADFPQGRHSPRWRLCLNRAQKAWRIRDDDTDSNKIWNTNGYKGIMRVRWMDSGPHIHVDGCPVIDAYGVVQF